MKHDSKTALLIIDIQNFYYPGGKWELENPQPAGKNAAKLLGYFREEGQLTVHIRHNTQPGFEIHPDVLPLEGEKVITKNHVNSFRETDLLPFLQENNIQKLVICGMMTHMCVEAATRAGADLGFQVTLIADACATKALEYKGNVTEAKDVHNAVLSAMQDSYAKVVNTNDFLLNEER